MVDLTAGSLCDLQAVLAKSHMESCFAEWACNWGVNLSGCAVLRFPGDAQDTPKWDDLCSGKDTQETEQNVVA